MRFIFSVFAFLLVLFFTQLNAQEHLDTAKSYVNVTELTGQNDGPEVEKFLKFVDRKKGDSWCAAFVSYCLGVNNVLAPKANSGVAQRFITKRSVSAFRVLDGTVKIPPGTILVWKRGNTWQGHVGFVVDWNGKSGQTIEGNTSPGRKGSQRNGDGVYIRKRKIYPGNYFRITHFTFVEYAKPIKLAGIELKPMDYLTNIRELLKPS